VADIIGFLIIFSLFILLGIWIRIHTPTLLQKEEVVFADLIASSTSIGVGQRLGLLFLLRGTVGWMLRGRNLTCCHWMY
jgi:hypothetical protein